MSPDAKSKPIVLVARTITCMVFGLITCLALSSCSRTHYEAHGATYFSITDGGKWEVLQVLDEFAAQNNFVKTREGTERRTADFKAKYLNAQYKNAEEYSYTVMNLLDQSCFGLFAYDYSRENPDRAEKIAENVKSALQERFSQTIRFYSEQDCSNPV